MINTKGVSAVVTTVVILALSLVAAGIVWGIVRGVVEEKGETVIAGSKCIETEIEILSAEFNGTDLEVQIRNTGSKSVDGIRIAAKDQTKDTIEPIEALATISLSIQITEYPQKVSAVAFVESENSGEKSMCPGEIEFVVKDNSNRDDSPSS